jgi:AcrR family transcriptional regulator
MSTQATARTRQPREKRLADILAAAREVFRERGYDETSITEIATRAGLVEGSIYRFFESKRELLIRVVELWYEEVLADYDHQLAGVRGVWNRLRFMVWHHLKSIHENPELVSLFFRHIRVSPDYQQSTVYELNRRYTNHIVEIVQSGIASGELWPQVSTTIVRDLIYGCIEHHTWRYVAGANDFDPDTAADAITDVVYRSLANHETRSSTVDRLEATIARLEAIIDKLTADGRQ